MDTGTQQNDTGRQCEDSETLEIEKRAVWNGGSVQSSGEN